MLRFVLLDLDDTLLDFAAAERAALSATLTEFGVAPKEELLAGYSEINAAMWRAMERGEIDREDLKRVRFRIFAEKFGLTLPVEKVKTAYEGRLGDGFFLMPRAEETLAALQKKYDLYVLTNGTVAVQTRRIAGSGVERYIKGAFYSEEVGFQKPKKEYFDAVFARIPDFSAESAVMVGDSLTSDVLGAKNAGLRSVWFNPKGQSRPKNGIVDLEIKDLAELLPLLKRTFG